MPDNKARFESMLFNLETSNKTDYRDGEIKPVITTNYQGKGSCLRTLPPPLKDVCALTDWHVPNVPFDLFGKPKDILRTNPYEIQKPYGRVPDIERKIVQKTRPRIVITPAESLDDMDDETRKFLVDDMYLTSKVYTMRDALTKANYNNVRAPFPDSTAPANPITLPKLLPPYVSPEWRMDSVSFDNRQLRAYCNPTRVFWLAKKPNCEECSQTATRDELKKMKRKH